MFKLIPKRVSLNYGYCTVAAFCCVCIVLFSGCGSCRNPVVESQIVEPIVDSVTKISLLFAGDVMQHIPQVNAARRDSSYDYSSCFSHMKPVFEQSDVVMVNLECTLSEDGAYSGYPNFVAPSELASYLKNSGVDVVMLANNHICDNGKQGVKSTIDIVERAGLNYTGAFCDSASYISKNPLYIDVKGINITVLNYTYGTNGYASPQETIINRIDTVRILSDLLKIDKHRTDYTIVFLHWGDEYVRQPNDSQKELSDWLIGNGVDFIIGSHPHVVQPVVVEKDSIGSIKNLTAYSLGNFVSNQRWRYSDGGILLKVVITHNGKKSRFINAEYIPAWVYKEYKNDSRNYLILPPSVADTILDNNPFEKSKYLQFIDDTHTLLSDSLSVAKYML